MRPNEVFDTDGQSIGTYWRSISSKDSKMVLIACDEQFGGISQVPPQGKSI